MPEEKGKIAVVDDDEMVRGVIASVLETHFDVVTYERAEPLLASPQLEAFNAVITDVSLPGVSGIEMMAEIHSQDESLPVIVITGFGDVDTAISAIKSGAFDYIIKPFNVEQVIASAKKAVEKSFLQRENARLVRELREKNVELERLNAQVNERNMQIERDLDIAGNLQECLFPAVVPSVEGVEFALRMKPAEKISGDFFDITQTADRRFRIIFADVSGHGVPAALYSAMMKSAITSLEGKNLSPAESISEINRYLIHSQKTMSYSYATVFIGMVDLDALILKYSNAGIPAPLVLRGESGTRTLEANGPYVGMFENAEYLDETVSLSSCDRMFIFTDGIFEAVGGSDSDFGYKRLVDFIAQSRGVDLETMVDMAYRRSLEEENRRPIVDDVTILGMKFL